MVILQANRNLLTSGLFNKRRSIKFCWYIPFWKYGEKNENLKKIRTAVDNNPTWIFGFLFLFQDRRMSRELWKLAYFTNISSPNGTSLMDNPVPSATLTSASFHLPRRGRKRRTRRSGLERSQIAVGGAVGLGAVVRGVPAFLGKDAWG